MLVWKEKAWGAGQKGLLEAAVPGVGDLIEARLQRGDVQASSEAPSAAQVVTIAGRLQLLQEPKPFLGER